MSTRFSRARSPPICPSSSPRSSSWSSTSRRPRYLDSHSRSPYWSEPTRSSNKQRLMDRRAFIAMVGGSILAAPVAAEAQQALKVPRIGYLSGDTRTTASTFEDAFRQGLRELGYVEDQNIAIEYRWAEGKYERLPQLAAELVRLKVDVMLAVSTPATQAAKAATRTIPIVFTVVADPVASGLVA